MNHRTQLIGTIDKVNYVHEESHFAVARLIGTQGVAGTVHQDVRVVGIMPHLQPGQEVVLDGQWETDPRFGRQFRVSSFQITLPQSKEAVHRYLSSGLIPGIGPALAGRLVAQFGVDTLSVIRDTPERLREVNGIGEHRLRLIQRSVAEQFGAQNAIVFLTGLGLTQGLSLRLLKLYGTEVVNIIQTDPYRLSDEVAGIGFRRADAIAMSAGVDKASPKRIMAGIAYIMAMAIDEGHCCLPESILIEQSSKLLDLDGSWVARGLATLLMAGRVVADTNADHTRVVYSSWLHELECAVAREVVRIAQTQTDLSLGSPTLLVQAVEKQLGLTLAPAQRDAVFAVLSSPLVVITGGPGTGKTTVVRAICAVLGELGEKLTLAAPTGRAAKRLGEVTGFRASTLHRTLEFSPNAGGFVRNEDNPLDVAVLIVDEASMVDVPLMASLVKALPTNSRLVLVGDVAQLPSVGPGMVLQDVIHSQVAQVVRLTRVYRQGTASLIVENAHRVLVGEMPINAEKGQDSDFFFIERETPDQIIETLRTIITKRLPNAFSVHPVDDIQLLAPMQRSELGAKNLNSLMQDWLNPGNPTTDKGAGRFRVADKVMQIRNNYDKDVFNGDMGRIVDVDLISKVVTVRFDDRVLVYDGAEVDDLELAYAITVHKSQGSEYPVVVLPIHEQHFMMLRRTLLYTALTRGKKIVILTGSSRAVRRAVSRDDATHRYGYLETRIRAAAERVGD
ncbi:MAG: ATP-dependent RecD-like DNA helicase [Myxococcales bacterium]|nr:ATP-dependent RecD-like DNA helicase [Myxococcales bacterium]